MKPHFSHCFLLCFVQPSNNLTNRYPTDGFTNIPLTESNFKLQKPYDIPLEQRYSFQNGVHRLWVYADDKPYDPSSPAQPRTEIRILGLDYSYGVWQFEGYGFVPNSTFGATIVQIHGATNYTTTIILRIYNWDMRAASAIPRAPNPSASRASSQTQRETSATKATSTSKTTIAVGTRTTPTATSATTTKAASSQTFEASRGATSTPTIA
ncbi:citrate-binding protein-like isoform X1 [Camellia sinensis]|uniref:citrate-binding protein-like isoform X1 n=1 Tax=Camellia sinensis TaxID=4442 RepID=UPI0010364611|nr:citrate-binding protein-like isoform X1 [Camellia sinensis]